MYQRFGPYKIEMTGITSYVDKAPQSGRIDAIELHASFGRSYRFTCGSPGYAEALAWHEADDTADDEADNDTTVSDVFEAIFDLLDDVRSFLGEPIRKPTIMTTGPTVDDAEFGSLIDPAALGAFGGMPATGPTTDVGA